MRWVLGLVIAVLACGVAGCATSGGALPYDPANPPLGNHGVMPEHFTQTQGGNRWWYYASAPGSAEYAPLAWGTAPAGTAHVAQCWLLNGGAPFIGKLALHPAAGQDAVLAWRPSAGGQAQITLTLESLTTDTTGDGIEVTAWQGDTRLLNPAIIPNKMGQTQTVATQHTVTAGALIYLRVNARENADSDWFKYTVDITVQ